MRRRSRPVLLTAGLLLAIALFSACGGDDDDSGSAPISATDGKVAVEAHDIFFNTKQIDATPGDLSVTLEEKGSLEHTFVVQDKDGKNVGSKLAVTSGDGSDSGSFALEAGTYTFFCDIPGHRAQGMQGKIVVK
jgi:plastocyanin